MINVDEIRKDFPIFKRFEREGIVYLDNAATTQKPRSVIDSVVNFYENHNSNVHRGVYRIGEEATELYNRSRENIAKFVGAKANNIVFVRNATEALNLTASGLVSVMGEGDEVLVSRMEHHSNIVPWQIQAANRKIGLKFIENGERERINWKLIEENLSERTKVVSLTQCSNILGTINDLNDVGMHLHNLGIKFVVDGAQSVPHMPVDVKKLKCDLMAFSGHKMLGPSGTGCLYGTEEILNEMPPYMGGGEMIREVYEDHFVSAEVPEKFEAGTPNIEGAIGLSAAVDYLRKIGMENIRDHEKEIISYILKREDELNMDDLVSYGPRDPEYRAGIFTFNIKKKVEGDRPFGNEVHPHDISHMADKIEGVELRSGHHCAMPMTVALGVYATARASFYIYNDMKDADRLFESIQKIEKRMIVK
ncbi:MAG: SufS family cysteine desulfurase [Candidatus Thermoplasmatota archaeon]|nr:SufS family cysteine desulfurase [Candidatus Thermoplasmatota archaeon]